jgi:DNA-binding NarL/FixJ family response regulator
MGRLDLPDRWRDEDDAPPPTEVSLPEWSDADRRDAALDRIAIAIASANDPTDAAPTKRHLEVLRLASEGLAYAEIASALDRSIETVRAQVKEAQRRLGAANTAAAVAEALRRRLIA